MIRTIAASAVILAGAVISLGQVCDDPYDNNLCVYPVSDPPSSIKDGAPSAFWSEWSGRDFIEMVAPDDCYPQRCGFIGSDDAIITIKAAATSSGLYMLSEVSDNTWVDRADANDWGADAIDFYFDAMSADDIWNCSDCTIGLYDSKLTYTTQQFQVWMGSSSPPSGCRLGYYDDNLWSWQTVGLDWAQLSVLYGIDIDIIQIDAVKKAQEWYFPWSKFAKGLPEGTQLNGLRLAFSGGYNDKDGDNTNPDCLRWLGKDPWAGDINYWGDFVLQSGIGGVPVTHVRQATVTDRRVAVVSSYTLRGERISVMANAMGAYVKAYVDGLSSTAIVIR